MSAGIDSDVFFCEIFQRRDELSNLGEVLSTERLKTIILYALSTYYFEKTPKNDASVLRTASKETSDVDQQRMQQELTQNNPRYPILNTK